MLINTLRIDDRLIHGQIVTQWIAASSATMIIVADDVASQDATQQMLLKLTVPTGIILNILSIADVAQFIKSDTSNHKVLLIVRNPKAAYDLLSAGYSFKNVNIGNISNTASRVGRKKLLPFIYVEPDDINYLKQLISRGINLEIRAIPSDKPIPFQDLLDKYSL